MILAFDSYYFDDLARTVAVAFKHWDDQAPHDIYTEIINAPADYEPGSFFKRELPCILSLIKQIDIPVIDCIVVDGYAILDNHGKLGLGGHLHTALDHEIPVIGVAKSDFRSLELGKIPVLRGESKNPLFVTASGMAPNVAASHISSMHGPFRMPTLLSLLDQATKHGLK